MMLKRRDFLAFLGSSAGTVAIGSLNSSCGKSLGVNAKVNQSETTTGLGFKPIQGPMPLATDNLEVAKQIVDYSDYTVVDDLVLPERFTYDVIAAWGDSVGDSRFGYNNDYLSFVETAPDEGLLTVNFEYVSGDTWTATYPLVIGKSLPFTEVKQTLAETKGVINAFALPDGDALKEQIKIIAKEGLIDLGLGVISLRRHSDGSWKRTSSPAERRITGISGLEDGRYLKATGPAVAVFTKANKKGYEDDLGERIIGSFHNCSGGTTPWGTVFSAEENFQAQVPEPVMADGSSFDPGNMPFFINEGIIAGQANVFGLAGNKYGWIVEIDPANPQDYGSKHTWLGRFRHEAVAIRAESGKNLAIYSGCDRHGGHVYKFVSQDTISDPKDKGNSRLLEKGMLYGAKFNPDGTGSWIAINPETPVNPVLPSQVEGRGGKGVVTLPNPDRSAGGIVKAISDADVLTFQQTFPTLGDLYEGSATEKQGAILIDAHHAANAAGVTCTARPEDVDLAPDGSLYIAFTSGSYGREGGPDKQIFQGPKGETPWEYGWIMHVTETGNNPAAMTFKWEIFALGGEPATGGAGFSNPDNLEFDGKGGLWMVTDMSTSKQNQAVSSRTDEAGVPLGLAKIQGIFGNNSLWYLPTSGTDAGNAYLFALGPMECETTGPFFSRDQKTLFLAVQHPGEVNGIRQNNAIESRTFAMQTTDGQEFMQTRQVPIGSNWPGNKPNESPRPAVVAIRRVDGGAIA